MPDEPPSSWFGAALDYLDRSAVILTWRWPRILKMAAVITAALGAVYLLFFRGRKALGAVTPRPENKARYMIKQSASLIKQAQENARSDPLLAYSQAIEATVLVKTARDVHDNVSMLSREVGADYYSWADHVNHVSDRLRATIMR